MRKISILLSFFILGTYASNAQSSSSAGTFSVTDTVYANVTSSSGSVTVPDYVHDISTDSIKINWKIVGTDFPTDWISNTGGGSTGLCDNNLCYNMTTLWPSGAIRTSNKYAPGVAGDYHMVINLVGSTSTGTHYVTTRIYNQANANDSATATFVINPALAVPTVTGGVENVLLYPNPARDEINIVYDANADVKNIAVYNIIGKVMSVYKVNGNSANLSLENIPGGIYFVRLINSQGEVVVTRKFTKQ